MNILPLLQEAGGLGSLATFGPLILIFVFFWFFIMRPQRKKQKAMQQMLGALKKGDKIVTIGGIYGVVHNVVEERNTVVVKIDGDTKIEFQKNAVASVINNDKSES